MVLLGEAQVCKNLSLMNGEQLFNGLQLDDHEIFYKDIDPVAYFQVLVLIGNRHWDLTGRMQAYARQFEHQGFFISRFQESRTKMAVNFNSRANNHVSQLTLTLSLT